MTTSTLSEARASHAQLEERNAVQRRFGFDPDASVRFMLEKALPLRQGSQVNHHIVEYPDSPPCLPSLTTG